MGANMDIDVYTRKTINFSNILNYFNKQGFSLTIENVQTITDWEFNNCKSLSSEINDNAITKELNKNNIVLIDAIANKTVNCGVHIEYNKYGFYEYGFYLDTDSLGIDTYYINKDSLILYKKSTEAIKELITPNDLIICAIGEETLVSSYNDVSMIIKESSILERWILPNEIKIDNYIQSKYDELYIYDNKDLLVID